MGDIGKGLGELIIFLLVVAAISVPLAIWQAVNIILWLAHHVSFH